MEINEGGLGVGGWGCKKLSPLMGPFRTSLRLGHVTEVTDGLSDQRDDELQGSVRESCGQEGG